MSTGKYSPTVSAAYSNDQDWWERNGGEDPENSDKPYEVVYFDRDGYDSYGYNVKGVDRAGYDEEHYLLASVIHDGDVVYELFNSVWSDWGVNDEGFPARI